MKVESLTQAICDLALRFGENGTGDSAIMSRPFGVAILIGGIDEEKGPQLYFADPSGTFMQYSAKAIGSASEVAQTQLQDDYRKDMSVEEAEILAIKILKQVMEEKINASNAQVAMITRERGTHVYSEEELGILLSKL